MTSRALRSTPNRFRWRPQWRPRLNPVLRRELRVRMRGSRAFVVLGVYLLALGMVVYGLEQILVKFGTGAQIQSFQIGQIIFGGFALMEVTLLALITPALTAGAISAEREHGTFDLLRATPVRAHSIVMGKLVAALGYVGLLIVASVPMAGLVFLFGGVAPADVGAVFALLSVTTLAFGLLGLFCSALVRRTSLAAVLAYATVALLIGGTVGGYIFWDALDGGLADTMTSEEFAIANGPNAGMVVAEGGAQPGPPTSRNPPRAMLALNPIFAMASLVADAVDDSPAGPNIGPGGQSGLPQLLDIVRSGRMDFENQLVFDEFGNPRMDAATSTGWPLWQLTVAIYGAVSLLLYFGAIPLVARGGSRRRRVRRALLRPAQHWRIAR